MLSTVTDDTLKVLSETEICAANAVGFQNWCIGTRVLRTETAPVVALAILNYRLAE